MAIARSLQRIELLYEYKVISDWPQDNWTRRRLAFIEDQLWPKRLPHEEVKEIRSLTRAL